MNMVEIFEAFEKALHSMEVTSLSAAIKLVISFLLGSVIGIERQTRRQSAGLRTFALICIASTAAISYQSGFHKIIFTFITETPDV